MDKVKQTEIITGRIPTQMANYLYYKLSEYPQDRWKRGLYFGKDIPKQSISFAPKGVKYDYGHGKSRIEEEEIDKLGKYILKYFNSKLNTQYNHLFIHKYTDGSQYINYHCDKSVDWCSCGKNGYGCGFTSVSLGDTRTFAVRVYQTRKVLKKYQQTHGMVISISKELNKVVEHSILKTRKEKGLRYSITMRHIV